MQRREFALATGALLLSGSALTACSTFGRQEQVPQITGPIPVTETSRPFLGAKERVEAAGYFEEEYFLRGQASVYDWVGASSAVAPVSGPGEYVTRVLVRRPRDPARFSGNVEVTILNASLGADFGGPSDFTRMVEQGDVWIGLTSKALTAKALQRFDPARYAELSWASPVQAEARCPHPTIIPVYMVGGEEAFLRFTQMGMQGSAPETEDGLIWDILGQLGALLKSDRRREILPGFSRPWVYMSGVSQSALYIRTWVTAFHERYRTSDGGPVYDGYFGVVAPAMARINQCSVDVPLDDPRQKIPTDLDVPFMSLSSEGEMWLAKHTRQPDAIGPRAGIVSYEIAGGAHSRRDIPGLASDTLSMPSAEDAARAGVHLPPPGESATVNDFPWAPIMRGAFHNLQLWVRQQMAPPQAPVIQLDSSGVVMRDSYGNALGGLRSPYIDAPFAAYRGALSETGGPGAVVGSKRLFTREELSGLYRTRESYVSRFSEAADRMAAERWISPQDAAAMKQAARAMRMPE